jgi:hypothetical protein
MNSMSIVVDQLTSELSEYRQTARGRQAAYQALAHAILGDDESALLVAPAFARQPARIGQPQLAA